MVDRIRNLGYIGGSRISVLQIRAWKPVLFDPVIRIQNEKKIRIRDKRSGSYFRESLVTGFKNTSILCQFSVADPNGIRCIIDPGIRDGKIRDKHSVSATLPTTCTVLYYHHLVTQSYPISVQEDLNLGCSSRVRILSFYPFPDPDLGSATPKGT
jgi:hypothetical protein